MTTELAYAFGYFRVLPQRRTLLAGEQPIKLGARAFDLLVAFVESSERMLTKGWRRLATPACTSGCWSHWRWGRHGRAAGTMRCG
jgi:hypothetical protein